MSMTVKFKPFNQSISSELQEKLKLLSPVLKIEANIPVFVTLNKGDIYYVAANEISAEDLELYITRDSLMQVTDEYDKPLAEKYLQVLKHAPGFLDQLAALLQAELETGEYDDQLLEQKDKAAKGKVLPEDISSGKLRPSPKNGTRLDRVSAGNGTSPRDAVYNLIKNTKSDVTVGEVTELFDSEFGSQLEEKMPRNEIAKLVTSLKADGLVRPMRRRTCLVAGREVLAWSADMTHAPTETAIKLAKKKMDDALERYESAKAEYSELLVQANLTDE